MGGTAKFICEAKGDKTLYLFDTFEGMPDNMISSEKDSWPDGTHIDTSVEEVKTYLSDYPNVHFIKGIFPESLSNYPDYDIANKKFSLVHLDVDLYKSTLGALEFFYPKMVPYGRIISHNYNLSPIPGGDTPGVKAAFMEYFEGREYSFIEIADTQCMVIKIPAY
jgi:hypothetical protein